jgi:hypothetical protein
LEKLAGTWKSTEILGDTVLNSDNFEMQLTIKKSGEINIIAKNMSTKPPKIEQMSGKIEGEYIVLNNQELGKFSVFEDHIKVVDVKQNKTAIFKKIIE